MKISSILASPPSKGALLASFLLVGSAPEAHAQSFGIANFHVSMNKFQQIFASNGVQSVNKIAPGTVDVRFNRNVNVSCSFVSSVIGSAAGLAVAINPAGAPDVLRVRTFTAAGALLDQPFSLIVSCGP